MLKILSAIALVTLLSVGCKKENTSTPLKADQAKIITHSAFEDEFSEDEETQLVSKTLEEALNLFNAKYNFATSKQVKQNDGSLIYLFRLNSSTYTCMIPIADRNGNILYYMTFHNESKSDMIAILKNLSDLNITQIQSLLE